MTIVHTTNCPYCGVGPMPAIDPESDRFNDRFHLCPNCSRKPRAGKQQDENGDWHIWYSSTVNHYAIPGGTEKINARLPRYQVRHLEARGGITQYLRLLIDKDMGKV